MLPPEAESEQISDPLLLFTGIHLTQQPHTVIAGITRQTVINVANMYYRQ